jgi:hypothetical protein
VGEPKRTVSLRGVSPCRAPGGLSLCHLEEFGFHALSSHVAVSHRRKWALRTIGG